MTYKLIYTKQKRNKQSLTDYEPVKITIDLKTKEDLKNWTTWLDLKKYKYIIK